MALPTLPTITTTPRYVTADLVAQTTVSITFPIFGDGSDLLVVFDGVKQTSGWELKSSGGPLATRPRPITDGYVEFTTAKTGKVEVWGRYVPRRVTNLTESAGPQVRDFNYEALLDKATASELYERLGRTFEFPAGTTGLAHYDPDDLAGHLLAFDDDGNAILVTRGGEVGPGEITGAELAAGAVAANLGFTPAPNRVYDVTLAPFNATLGGSLNTALPAAVAAAEAAGGGTVLIPASLTWTLSVPVPMGNNVTVRGMGRGATTITCTSATAHMFTATSKNMMGFFDMTLDNSATKTAGSAFYFNTCSVVAIRNVQIANHIFPIEEVGSVSIWLDEIEISGLKASTGIGIIIDGGNDHYLRNVFIKTAGIGTQALAGINIRATGGTWLSGCGTLWCNDGLLINPGSGKIVEHIFSTMNAYDTGTGHGIRIVPSGTGIVRRNYFVQDWTATNSENGVTIDAGASGVVDTNFFIGHRSVNNLKHGMLLTKGLNTHFESCFTSGNSGAASGTYDGIRVADTVTDFSIRHCQSGAAAGFSNIQGYGINVDGSTHDRYIIVGNDCQNNVTGGHRDAGATTGKQVFGNLPVSASDRSRLGGVNFVQPLSAGWQIDSDASGFTLASGAEVTLTTGNGMLLLTLDSTGGTAIALIGTGNVAITQVGTSFAVTSSPSSSQIGVYYHVGSSTYRVKNGFATTQTIYPGSWKTRPAN